MVMDLIMINLSNFLIQVILVGCCYDSDVVDEAYENLLFELRKFDNIVAHEIKITNRFFIKPKVENIDYIFGYEIKSSPLASLTVKSMVAMTLHDIALEKIAKKFGFHNLKPKLWIHLNKT